MKRLIYLSLLLISSLISYADNWSRLGYKGKVTKTTIFGYGSGKESFTFDISGNLLGITTDCYNVSFSTQMLTRTSTGFSGTCKIKGFDGKISITTGKKGITKIYIKYDTGSLTVTNSYDSKGKLTKKVYEDIWYTEEEPTYDSNIGSELNRYSKNQSSTLNRYGNRQQANLNRLQKKINDALAKGDMAAYQRARDEYMKAYAACKPEDFVAEMQQELDVIMILMNLETGHQERFHWRKTNLENGKQLFMIQNIGVNIFGENSSQKVI